jgi:hypothetical protein
MNLRIMCYVDDWVLFSTPDKFASEIETVRHTIEDLGWRINEKKSNFIPGTEQTYIGFRINTDTDSGYPELWPSRDRINKLRRLLRRALARQTLSARDLARLTGQCISMSMAVGYAKIMLRSVYEQLKLRTSWESMIELNEQSIIDLTRWLQETLGHRK